LQLVLLPGLRTIALVDALAGGLGDDDGGLPPASAKANSWPTVPVAGGYFSFH